ncbi:MAG: TetR/AcrR family transcriptional regulator [Gammaproteobacteria bacterium]|nr:TetR/AcrR family transcriptional regulator [Gammaproteobacteria bacterium]MBQ0840582.1 TetR/AcrR family transcriptional regulator [Gammaproteobacteria bacterium]
MARPGTKQRILATTLALFNQLGTPNASTNHIALELDISPGNLYYHYPNKEQLIETLFCQYEQALQPLTSQAFTEELSIEDIWFFLHLNFELALEYRFIYQDSDYITSKCPSLAAKFQHLLTALYQSLLRLLTALSSTGILLVTADDMIEDISLNMLLICTQWIHFKKHLSGISEANIASDHFNQGIYQVLSLLLPYLDQAHREHLQHLREAYQ